MVAASVSLSALSATTWCAFAAILSDRDSEEPMRAVQSQGDLAVGWGVCELSMLALRPICLAQTGDALFWVSTALSNIVCIVSSINERAVETFVASKIEVFNPRFRGASLLVATQLLARGPSILFLHKNF